MGFDDEAFSAYCCPPLTTVSQPLFEMGQAAVRAIVARVNGQPLSPRQLRRVLVRARVDAPHGPGPAPTGGRRPSGGLAALFGDRGRALPSRNSAANRSTIPKAITAGTIQIVVQSCPTILPPSITW